MNATMRRIDQVTNILAPLAVGQVMTLASNVVGCGFILGWNLVSLIVEFFFLSRVYRIVPALSIKPPVEDEDLVYRQRTERTGLRGKGRSMFVSHFQLRLCSRISTEDFEGSQRCAYKAECIVELKRGAVVKRCVKMLA